MDAIDRVRIDGKTLSAPSTRESRSTSCTTRSRETDFPGGPRDRLPGPDPAHAAAGACRRPTTSATDPSRRASTRRPSTPWPHPSRSSNRRTGALIAPTERRDAPGRARDPHAPSRRQVTEQNIQPPRTEQSAPAEPFATLHDPDDDEPYRGHADPAAPRHRERRGHRRRQHLQGLLRIDTRRRQRERGASTLRVFTSSSLRPRPPHQPNSACSPSGIPVQLLERNLVAVLLRHDADAGPREHRRGMFGPGPHQYGGRLMR